MPACPICENENATIAAQTIASIIECPACGQFRLTREAIDDLPAFFRNKPERRAILRHKICRSQVNNRLPLWTYEICEDVVRHQSLPSVFEQADNLLEWLGNKSISPGDLISVESLPAGAYAGTFKPDSVHFLINSLSDAELINFTGLIGGNMIGRATLTMKGWERYDVLTKGGLSYNKAFMAMKFGDDNLDTVVNNFFKPAVEQTGYNLFRLDDRPQAGLIDIRLRQEIKTSKFIVADLSHANNGAYWEAGFAEGIGKQVIYTCERSKFEEVKTHFDVNHHLTIICDGANPAEAAENLKAAIRFTFPEAKQAD